MNIKEKFAEVLDGVVVSNYGRVLSRIGGFELSTFEENEFIYVWIKRKRYAVHKLVAEKFLKYPDVIGGKLYVNHIDGESRNNAVWNLRYETVKRYPVMHDIPFYHDGRAYKVVNNRIYRSKSYVKRDEVALAMRMMDEDLHRYGALIL